jgi:hypothetical protein
MLGMPPSRRGTPARRHPWRRSHHVFGMWQSRAIGMGRRCNARREGPAMSISIGLTRCLAIALATGALISGLLAAWFWERAARVPVVPLNGDPQRDHAGLARAHESVVVDGPVPSRPRNGPLEHPRCTVDRARGGARWLVVADWTVLTSWRTDRSNSSSRCRAPTVAPSSRRCARV